MEMQGFSKKKAGWVGLATRKPGPCKEDIDELGSGEHCNEFEVSGHPGTKAKGEGFAL